MAAAERRRLHVIAGLGGGLDAGGVHHRGHQRDGVLRTRHDGERLETVARAVPGDFFLGEERLKELQVLLEPGFGVLDGNAEARRLEAEGALAHAQHQPPVAQRLGLHDFAREDPHVADGQLAHRGDEPDVLGVGGDLHRHLQGRGDQQDVEQVMLRNRHAAVADRLRMDGLCHDVPVKALAAHGRVQHVARQEVDEFHEMPPV